MNDEKLFNTFSPSPPTGLLLTDLESIAALLRRYTAVETAVLFGSRAKGTHRPGSDVDIALQGSHLTQRMVTSIGDFLNEETLMPYHFDVVNYHTIENPNLVAHIDRVGVVLYTAEGETQSTPSA